jgi:hypothetical protein
MRSINSHQCRMNYKHSWRKVHSLPCDRKVDRMFCYLAENLMV